MGWLFEPGSATFKKWLADLSTVAPVPSGLVEEQRVTRDVAKYRTLVADDKK
ncbi:MAG: hypothetical protein ACI4XG_12725 [Bradyrhizobium sp.]